MVHLAVILDSGEIHVGHEPIPHDQMVLPTVRPYLDVVNEKAKRTCRRRGRRAQPAQFEFAEFGGRWPWKSKTTAVTPLSLLEMKRIKRADARRLTKAVRAERLSLAYWERVAADERPKTRDDCKNGPRPCHWVSCEHHLFLDVGDLSGSIKYNFPLAPPAIPGVPANDALDLHQVLAWMPETCALDVAERGGVTLEEIGVMLNVSMERARQIEMAALAKMKAGVDDDVRTTVAAVLESTESLPVHDLNAGGSNTGSPPTTGRADPQPPALGLGDCAVVSSAHRPTRAAG